MRSRLRSARRPGSGVRASFAALLGLAILVASATPALGALPSTSTPVLTLNRTIRTTPFTNTTISSRDGEGTAFVARDNSLWLVGDKSRTAFEVDRTSGALKRVIERSTFEAARQFPGTGPQAGANRAGDVESIAYDAANDVLYAFSGTCCTSSTLPTVFRLTRVSGAFQVQSWQPLPSGADYTAAAWNPADGKIYVAKGRNLRSYDYVSNTAGSAFTVRQLSGIFGLEFSSNGADLIAVTKDRQLIRVNWATKRIATGWKLDLTPFGVMDSRGVSILPNPTAGGFDQFYVYDGYDARPSGDPLKYAVFVFDVSGAGGGGGGGGGGGNLVGNPGFEADTSGWNTSGSVAGVTLSRVAGGHGGTSAASLGNGGTASGRCQLNDSPNWVTNTAATTYTGSLWVRADAAGATLGLRFREYSGGTLVGAQTVNVPLTTTWQQVTVSRATQAGSSLDLNAFIASAPPGHCFYADDASITSP